jgi:hypothetical protein
MSPRPASCKTNGKRPRQTRARTMSYQGTWILTERASALQGGRQPSMNGCA